MRRLKLLNIARESKAPHFNKVREFATDKEKLRLKEEIELVQAKELKIEQVARRAGLELEYQTDYRILCDEAHTLPRSTEHFILINDQHGTGEFVAGPSDKDITYILFTSTRFLYMALVAASAFLKIEATEELKKLNETLKELAPQVDIRPDPTVGTPAAN